MPLDGDREEHARTEMELALRFVHWEDGHDNYFDMELQEGA